MLHLPGKFAPRTILILGLPSSEQLCRPYNVYMNEDQANFFTPNFDPVLGRVKFLNAPLNEHYNGMSATTKELVPVVFHLFGVQPASIPSYQYWGANIL